MLTIYLDKSNIIKLQLQSGRGAANLATTTRIVVKIDDVEIDSAHEDNLIHEYITWLDVLPTFNEPNLFLKLGKHPDLQGYEGFREMRITVYDDVNVNGLVWIDQQPIKLITELDQEPTYSGVTPVIDSDEKVAILSGGPAGYLWGTDGTDGVIRVVSPLTITKSVNDDYIEISTSISQINTTFDLLTNHDVLVYNVADSVWENKQLNVIPYNIPATVSPVSINDMTFQLTDNTTLTVKVKGTDGVIRSANITLS